MKALLATVSEQTVNHLKTGQNVRAARRKAKLTLAALASKLDIEVSRLSRLENGWAPWTPDLVKKVEGALR